MGGLGNRDQGDCALNSPNRRPAQGAYGGDPPWEAKGPLGFLEGTGGLALGLGANEGKVQPE